MEHFVRTQAMFFKSYVGQYYREYKGLEGEEPLNFIFNTLRSYIPNLVAQSPITKVTTPYLPYKMYAELLGMGLDTTARQIHLKETLRAWITNAFFGWGIVRVGIKATGELLQVDDVYIDNGQVYVKNVMLENFGFDPSCTDIREAKCQFERVTVPRQWLLDTKGLDHDLIVRLPSADQMAESKLSDMTRDKEGRSEMTRLQDEVNIVQMFVPETEQIVLMGDPTQAMQDKFISIKDYNGVKEGPYVFLSFSPPVEGNPFPVAPVSVWYDLHCAANRVFNKMLEQIDQQKDVGLFNPALADEVNDIKEATTGDWIPTTDPKGAQVISLGGQNQKNETALTQLQVWFNYMSGNPDQMAGNLPGGGQASESATKTMTLQNNSSIVLSDMQDIAYDQTGEVQRRVAWYLHTDPFINLPLTKRVTGGEEKQLILTPEQRMGDFLDYAFKIVSRSMTKMDPQVRAKRIEEFCVRVLPTAAQSAMVMMQMGQPFNLPAYCSKIAEEWGILDEVADLFVDPMFQQKMQLFMAMGNKNPGKAQGGGIDGAVQNQGSPAAMPVASPATEFNQNSQSVAAAGQSTNQGTY
jgi:hypothetical protein